VVQTKLTLFKIGSHFALAFVALYNYAFAKKKK